MKIRDVEEYTPDMKFTDFENFFTVHQNDDGKMFYNLNETLYINIPEDRLQSYTLKKNMFWTTISYVLFETTSLAWLLMKINDVKPLNMFDVV